jgi:hypothetical protein
MTEANVICDIILIFCMMFINRNIGAGRNIKINKIITWFDFIVVTLSLIKSVGWI